MTASWPAGLPQFVLAGSSETFAKDGLESQVGGLALQTRQRVIGQVKDFSLSIACTPAEAKIFEAFWRDELSGGALPFSWVNPRTQVSGLYRFKGGPPAYQAHPSGVSVTVAFQLVQMS